MILAIFNHLKIISIKSSFIVLLFLLFSYQSIAQIGKPSCELVTQSDIILDLNEIEGLMSTMFDILVSPSPNPLCPSGGGAHNMTWFGFVAGCGDYEIQINSSNCNPGLSGELGIQSGLFLDCSFQEAVYCDPQCSEDAIILDNVFLNPGDTYFFFLDGCSGSVCDYSVQINGDFIPFDLTQCAAYSIFNSGSNSICIGEMTQLSTDNPTNGVWASSDTAIAKIDTMGLVTGIDIGRVYFTFVDTFGVKLLFDSISIVAPIINQDQGFLCLDESLQLTSDSEGGVWTSSDESVATIGFATGIITPVAQGIACFTITDNASGCSSTCLALNIEDCSEPCDTNFVRPAWTSEVVGDIDESYNVLYALWLVGPLVIESQALEQMFFYDYSTGDVYMKRNLGNGKFEEGDVFLFHNQYHYENGIQLMYLEDINNDGLNDLIIAQNNSSGEADKIIIYLQDMSNSFEEYTFFEVEGLYLFSKGALQFEDFDHNGYLDIIYTAWEYSKLILIHENNNVSYSNEIEELIECEFHIIDMDQDGFKDIVHFSNIYYFKNDTFITQQNYLEPSFNCEEFLYFDNDSGNLLYTYGIYEFNENTSQFELCLEDDNSDYKEVFEANIFSSSRKNIVVRNNGEIKIYDKPLTCNATSRTENFQTYSRTKTMDINNDGYTDFVDFIVVEEPIIAHINPGNVHQITGTAYLDENENGVFDQGETPLNNVLIKILPQNMAILTNQFGQYSFAVEYGEYNIMAKINEGEWIEAELNIDLTVESHCNENNDFGFVSQESPEAVVLSVSHTVKRCDSETHFYIDFQNIGSENLTGKIIFTFDEVVTYVDAGPKPTLIESNKLVFDIIDLIPFRRKTYNVILLMPPGSNDLPVLDFGIDLVDEQGVVLATYSFSDQLKCSFDPNDKLTYPNREGEDNLTLFSEFMDYTVRFQNTGNDTAFTVKIVDQLDDNIDPNSIRVMSSSHSVETCIEENNKLTFLFENINLVDSTTSFVASQGFVTFRCDQKSNRNERTEVFNHADIIFDTNEPVITNDVKNTLVSSLCIFINEVIFVEICPGDFYESYSEEGTYLDTLLTAESCDSIRTIHLSYADVPEYDIDTTICPDQSVFGLNVSGTYALLFTAVEGCDTTINLTLVVLDENDSQCIDAVNDNEKDQFYLYPNPSDDKVFIKGSDQISHFKLISIDGQYVPIEYFKSDNEELILITSNLPVGLYVIELFTKGIDNAVMYKKIMILR